jgi:hypothetical protein
MSLTVRSKAAWQSFMDDKYAFMAHGITGIPRYVVAGIGSALLAFMKNRKQYVYTDINSAYGDCVTGQGDAIILIEPGQNYTLTAAVVASKNNVSIWGAEAWLGVPMRKPTNTITAAAASDGFTITGADMQFHGVGCIPITAKNFCTASAAAARLRFRNCYFDLLTPAVNIATQIITQTGAAPDVHLSGCVCVCGGAQGPMMDATGFIRFLVENCEFDVTAGTWAAAMKTGAATSGKVRGCWTTGLGTAMTLLVGTGTEGASALLLSDNRVAVGHTLGSGYGGANARTMLDENFIATVSGGTGGTLITTTT